MRQLNFAAAPNYNQQFREVQRLFRQDLGIPARASLRELLEQTMRDHVSNQVQAGWHERRPGRRRDFRNGSYRRRLLTSLGPILLDVPRTRGHRSAAREILPAYARRAPEVDTMLREVFLRGVSTRQVGAILHCLCGESVSATTVSKLTATLDDAVRRYHERRLADRYRYLLLDGVFLRVRDAGSTKRRVVLCAYGITLEGRRELIDFQLGRYESEPAWEAFLQRLFARGLAGKALELVVTDGNTGLHRALALVYPDAPRQRCWAHKIRNVTDRIPRALLSRCRKGLRAIYAAEDRAAAQHAFRLWRDRWRSQAPRAVRCLEADLEELLTVYDCPAAVRVSLRTTNLIERCFVEVRRRTRPMSVMADGKSCGRILFAVFMRLNANWQERPLPPNTQKA